MWYEPLSTQFSQACYWNALHVCGTRCNPIVTVIFLEILTFWRNDQPDMYVPFVPFGPSACFMCQQSIFAVFTWVLPGRRLRWGAQVPLRLMTLLHLPERKAHAVDQPKWCLLKKETQRGLRALFQPFFACCSWVQWMLPCKLFASCWFKFMGRSSYELRLPVTGVLSGGHHGDNQL